MAERDKRVASPETLEKLKAFNAEQTDWEGKCRVCGRKLRGKLSEMRCDHGITGEACPTGSPCD